MKTAEEMLIKECGLIDTSDPKEYCNGLVNWESALDARKVHKKGYLKWY